MGLGGNDYFEEDEEEPGTSRKPRIRKKKCTPSVCENAAEKILSENGSIESEKEEIMAAELYSKTQRQNFGEQKQPQNDTSKGKLLSEENDGKVFLEEEIMENHSSKKIKSMEEVVRDEQGCDTWRCECNGCKLGRKMCYQRIVSYVFPEMKNKVLSESADIVQEVGSGISKSNEGDKEEGLDDGNGVKTRQSEAGACSWWQRSVQEMPEEEGLPLKKRGRYIAEKGKEESHQRFPLEEKEQEGGIEIPQERNGEGIGGDEEVGRNRQKCVPNLDNAGVYEYFEEDEGEESIMKKQRGIQNVDNGGVCKYFEEEEECILKKPRGLKKRRGKQLAVEDAEEEERIVKKQRGLQNVDNGGVCEYIVEDEEEERILEKQTSLQNLDNGGVSKYLEEEEQEELEGEERTPRKKEVAMLSYRRRRCRMGQKKQGGRKLVEEIDEEGRNDGKKVEPSHGKSGEMNQIEKGINGTEEGASLPKRQRHPSGVIEVPIQEKNPKFKQLIYDENVIEVDIIQLPISHFSIL